MFMYTDYNQHLLDNVKKIHFIGCGGSGMYPLIQILAAKGYEISGSDVLLRLHRLIRHDLRELRGEMLQPRNAFLDRKSVV